MSDGEARSLAVAIRRARKARSLSVRGLAELAGVNHVTLLKLEQGVAQMPKPDTLVLLARALRMPAADLFMAAGWLPPTELPDLGAYLRGKFRELDDEQIASVEHYVGDVLAACPRARSAAH